MNSLYGLFASVTRQIVQGEPNEGWFPEQKLTLEESLRAYTMGSAYGAFEEETKGSINPGKLADFVVLHDDLFTTEPLSWLRNRADLTIVGGRVVYEVRD